MADALAASASIHPKHDAPIVAGMYEMFEGRLISDECLSVINTTIETRFVELPDRVQGVKAWIKIVKGKTASVDRIKKPLQATEGGISKEELALVEKLCYGHTHEEEHIEGVAYHPDRFIDEDPEFRAKVHQTFDEIDRNGDHHITYMELLKWWKGKNKETGGDKLTEEMIHSASSKFHEFDTNENGTIDKDELCGLIRSLNLESLLSGVEEAEIVEEPVVLTPEQLQILCNVGCKLINLAVRILQKMHDKEHKKKTKTYDGPVPEKIVMQGWLGKTAGDKPSSKMNERYFTLGDDMMAYYDIEEGEEPDIGMAPEADDCKGTIIFGKDPIVDGTGPKKEGRENIHIKTKVVNNKGKTDFLLFARTHEDQVAWLEALGDYLPRKPTVVITKDPEYGGNFVDVEFHDLSAPGPAAILLHGTTGADMHCSSIDEHERNVLKGLRQGHLLIGINGKDVAPDSMEDCLKKLTTIQRPLLMKFYEPADIEAIFTTDAETGLYFKGSSGRNFSIDTIEPDSEAQECGELRPGLLLKTFNGKDVSMLSAEQLSSMTKTPERPLTMVFVAHAYLDIWKKTSECEVVVDDDPYSAKEGGEDAEPEPEVATETVPAELGHMLWDGTDVDFRVAEFGASSYEPLDKKAARDAGVPTTEMYETAVVNADPPCAECDLENDDECAGKWVLVRKGECSYAEKAINCQSAGAIGVIIVNDQDKLAIPKDGKGEAGEVNIPVIMVALGRVDMEPPEKACVCFERGTSPMTLKGQMLSIKFGKMDMEVRFRYQDKFEEMQKMKMARYQARRLAALLSEKLANTLRAQHMTLHTAFDKFDADGNGTISMEELVNGFNEFGVDVNEDQMRRCLAVIDGDGNAEIDYSEFFKSFAGDLVHDVELR